MKRSRMSLRMELNNLPEFLRECSCSCHALGAECENGCLSLDDSTPFSGEHCLDGEVLNFGADPDSFEDGLYDTTAERDGEA